MSVDFKIKNSTQVEQNIKEAFNKVIKNEKLLNTIGQNIVSDIQTQTRSGKSIPDGGKLAPLSSRWIRMRKRIEDNKQDTFSPGRSNLTITGQLLDVLTHAIVGIGKLRIFSKGQHKEYNAEYQKSWTRKAYTTKAGAKVKKTVVTSMRDGTYSVGKSIDNETLSQYVSEVRPYIGVRPEMKKRIKTLIVSHIRRAVRFFK